MTDSFETIIDSIAQDGYGVLDNFLTADEVGALAAQLRYRRAQGVFRTAGVGQGRATVETQIRGDEILWLDAASLTTEEAAFLARIDQFREYVNKTCYMGLRDAEFHYALYPPGTFYKRHLDQFRTGRVGGAQRKLSVICYLNADWMDTDGGQLAIYLPNTASGTEETITIEPLGGRLVCFESGRLEHEVKPAGRERLSLTGWLRTGDL